MGLQYCRQEQEVEDRLKLQYCGQPEEKVEVDVVEPQSCNQPEPELEGYRLLTLPTTEHKLLNGLLVPDLPVGDLPMQDFPVRELPLHQLPVHKLPVPDFPATFNIADDSLDDDSISDYMNNTSEDEEDYDEGMNPLPIMDFTIFIFSFLYNSLMEYIDIFTVVLF